jgi:hypothetical protein
MAQRLIEVNQIFGTLIRYLRGEVHRSPFPMDGIHCRTIASPIR